jgi:hypothetical protein
MTKSTLLDPDKQHLAHENVCLLELETSKELDKLMAEPSIRAIVWTRLDDTRALVDSTRVHDLIDRLDELDVSCRYRDALLPEDE